MAKFSRGHAATKKLIASCAATGVGIEGIEGAPNFRFVPRDMMPRSEFDSSPPPKARDSFEGYDNTGPSKRGSIACGRAKPKNIRNWTPARLSLDCNYWVRMAGDDGELTDARRCYSEGNPGPLREWLKAQADERRGLALIAARQAAAAAAPVQLALAA
jgi:hypothetical protein